MTTQVEQRPNPDDSWLVREVNHRINNELTCAICAVYARAAEAGSDAVKTALLDVVDLLHQCADVHRALQMPDPGHLADAATYLQQLCLCVTKYRLDRLTIGVLLSADDLRLEGERCWKLGMIVSELLTNVAKHARFDDRHPEIRVELRVAGSAVTCRVSDNGSAAEPARRGQGLTIIGEIAGSLGARVQTSCAAEGFSTLITFALNEAEQRAADATGVVKRRKAARLACVDNGSDCLDG